MLNIGILINIEDDDTAYADIQWVIPETSAARHHVVKQLVSYIVRYFKKDAMGALKFSIEKYGKESGDLRTMQMINRALEKYLEALDKPCIRPLEVFRD